LTKPGAEAIVSASQEDIVTREIALIPYLDRVRAAFTSLTAPDIELFPDWKEAWTPHLRLAEDAEPGAKVSRKSLKHAVALIKLYGGQPAEEVLAEARSLPDRDPEAVAGTLVGAVARQAYDDPQARPSPDEWGRNRMLKALALKIGHQFMLECLHGWARETANTPEHRRHKDRGFAYSCFVPPEDGPLTGGRVLQQTLRSDEETLMSLQPRGMMLLARRLQPLCGDEDRLGAAVVAVMHYGYARQCSEKEIAAIVDLIVAIESE
jgi:hypothetical protein